MTQHAGNDNGTPSPGRLDCRDLPTAVRSLGHVLNVPQEELSRLILDHDPSAYDQLEPIEDWTAKDLLTSLGSSSAPESAVFYHGTRLIDLESVRTGGLLPLSVMTERIWTMLADLVADRCRPHEWVAFRQWLEDGGGGHDGDLYRSKIAAEIHHGPYAVLVRPELLNHERVNAHDYLDCPEIIQDISRCFDSRYDADLEDRFRAASIPTIVAFASDDLPGGTLETALWFAYVGLRDGDLPANTRGYVGHGHAVPPADILAVDRIESRT